MVFSRPISGRGGSKGGATFLVSPKVDVVWATLSSGVSAVFRGLVPERPIGSLFLGVEGSEIAPRA